MPSIKHDVGILKKKYSENNKIPQILFWMAEPRTIPK